MRRTGYGLLFFLVGIFFPILIWVGLGVVVQQWVRERMLKRHPAPTVGEILAAPGLVVQWKASGTESLAVAVFGKQPMSEIRELLQRAGL